MKDAGCPIGELIVYTEETDINDLLGRPNQYTSKTDFADTTKEQPEQIEGFDKELIGGTIEVFDSKDDCDARHKYLEGYTDPSLGAFGLYTKKGGFGIIPFLITLQRSLLMLTRF